MRVFGFVFGFALLLAGVSPAVAKTSRVTEVLSICSSMIHDPKTLEKSLKTMGWVDLEDEFIDMMGRPADPDAVVVGYKYLHDDTDGVDIIGVTSHRSGKHFRICTVPIIGWESFSSLEQELFNLFGAKQIDVLKQGVISYHFYIGRHPIYEKATYIMMRDNRKDDDEDLVQISMQVDIN